MLWIIGLMLATTCCAFDITGFAVYRSAALIYWESKPYRPYQVQVSTNGYDYVDVGPIIYGTAFNTTTFYCDTNPLASHAIYRVILCE